MKTSLPFSHRCNETTECSCSTQSRHWADHNSTCLQGRTVLCPGP